MQGLWGFDPPVPLGPQPNEAGQLQTEYTRKTTYYTEEMYYRDNSDAEKGHSAVPKHSEPAFYVAEQKVLSILPARPKSCQQGISRQ